MLCSSLRFNLNITFSNCSPPPSYLLKVDYLPTTYSNNKIILEYVSEAVVIYSSICLVCLLLWTLSPMRLDNASVSHMIVYLASA